MTESTNQYQKLENILGRIFNQSQFEDILDILQTVHLRVSIVERQELLDLTPTKQKELLNDLLEDEINGSLTKFIDELTENKLVSVLVGEDYNLFVDYLIKDNKENPEMIFSSAIELSNDFKTHLKEIFERKCRRKVRLVFVVDSEVVAGFVCKFLGKTYDFSFKTFGSQLILQNIKKVL